MECSQVACQSSQGLRSDLLIGFDKIAGNMAAYNPLSQNSIGRELPSSFVNPALPEHTSTVVATAHGVMSTAQSVISEISEKGSVTTLRGKPVPATEAPISEEGTPLTPKDRDRILNWIPSHSNPGRSTIPSTTTKSGMSITRSAILGTTDNGSTTSLVSYGSKNPEDDDLEIEAVGAMFKAGSFHMVKTEYADAQSLFLSGLERARSMTTKTRSHLAIEEQELWLAYSKLYQGETRDLLPALETQYQSKPNTLLAVRALHAVAQVYVFDKKYELAESACRQVMKDLRVQVGEDSRYYLIHRRSLTLLADICRLKGHTASASTYLNLIAPAYKTKKDGKWDDVPEPSMINFRHRAYRVRAGDKIELQISYLEILYGSNTRPPVKYGTHGITVGDRSWPSVLLKDHVLGK